MIGIILYSEMCGRVAAISKRPVFDLVRERVGFSAGLGDARRLRDREPMTCAAEVGGVAIVLQLLSGLPYRARILLGVIGLASSLGAAVRVARATLRLVGLCLLVFAVAAVKLHPQWGTLRHGFVPGSRRTTKLVYLYFVVGLLGAALTPYGLLLLVRRRRGRLGREGSAHQQGHPVIGYGLGGISRSP